MQSKTARLRGHFPSQPGGHCIISVCGPALNSAHGGPSSPRTGRGLPPRCGRRRRRTPRAPNDKNTPPVSGRFCLPQREHSVPGRAADMQLPQDRPSIYCDAAGRILARNGSYLITAAAFFEWTFGTPQIPRGSGVRAPVPCIIVAELPPCRFLCVVFVKNDGENPAFPAPFCGGDRL